MANSIRGGDANDSSERPWGMRESPRCLETEKRCDPHGTHSPREGGGVEIAVIQNAQGGTI